MLLARAEGPKPKKRGGGRRKKKSFDLRRPTHGQNQKVNQEKRKRQLSTNRGKII